MLRRTQEILRRIARVGMPPKQELPEYPPPPRAIPPGLPMSSTAEAEYLEECQDAGLDPNDQNTPGKLDEIRLRRTCEVHGLDPNSPHVQDDINRIVLEELRKDE